VDRGRTAAAVGIEQQQAGGGVVDELRRAGWHGSEIRCGDQQQILARGEIRDLVGALARGEEGEANRIRAVRQRIAPRAADFGGAAAGEDEG
jgi:hypothetical protein